MISTEIVEDMARRATVVKMVSDDGKQMELLVPDYVKVQSNTLSDLDILRESYSWGSFAPNLDKTASEMLKLDQLDSVSIPDVRHRKIQLD